LEGVVAIVGARDPGRALALLPGVGGGREQVSLLVQILRRGLPRQAERRLLRVAAARARQIRDPIDRAQAFGEVTEEAVERDPPFGAALVREGIRRARNLRNASERDRVLADLVEDAIVIDPRWALAMTPRLRDPWSRWHVQEQSSIYLADCDLRGAVRIALRITSLPNRCSALVGIAGGAGRRSSVMAGQGAARAGSSSARNSTARLSSPARSRRRTRTAH
jgi:hypothetical protein